MLRFNAVQSVDIRYVGEEALLRCTSFSSRVATPVSHRFEAKLIVEYGRHFIVPKNAKGVRVAGLELNNGAAASAGGGCVRMEDGADLELHNVIFRNCSAPSEDGKGGAVFVGRNSTLLLAGSRIVNGYARQAGGGLHADEGSRVVMLGAVVYSTHSGVCPEPVRRFPCESTNWVDSWGDDCDAYAAYPDWCGYEQSTDECCVCGGGKMTCEPDGYGGACNFELGSTISMHSVEIRNCSSPLYGGGLYLRNGVTLNLTNVSLHENTVSKLGAAIFMGPSSVLHASQSSFDSNSAGERAAIVGWKSCLIELEHSSVSYNSAGDFAGGIYVTYQSVLKVQNSRIDGNSAGQDGGAILALSDSIVQLMGSSSVNGNSVGDDAGGIYLGFNSALEVSGKATINGNTCADGGGGILLSTASTATLAEGTSVQGNIARRGGGIFLQKSSSVSASSAIIEKNTAADDGGGFYVLEDARVLLSEGSSVRGNTAGSYGGGLYLQDSSLTSSGAISIDDNTATDGGGMLIVDGAATLAGGSSVRGNNARDGGGGVYMQGAMFETLGSVFIHDNTAAKVGGGFLVTYSATVALAEGSSVRNNVAGNTGGGFYVKEAMVEAYGAVTIDGNLAKNKTGGNGGGVAAEASRVMLASGSVLSHNSAGDLGGGLYLVRASTVETSGDVVITYNTAEGGGGIYAVKMSKVVLGDGTLRLSNNAAGGHGGACALVQESSLEENQVRESNLNRTRTLEVHDNVAKLGDGGGIAVSEDSRVIMSTTFVTFKFNTAGRGGGLFVNTFVEAPRSTPSCSMDVAVAISRVVFWQLHLEGNSAIGDGGGLFGFSSVELVAGGFTNIIGNTAARGGGAALSGSSIIVQPGHILKAHANTARAHGGALALLAEANVDLREATSCSESCFDEHRGDKVCHASWCMNAGCNFDDGDCVLQRMEKAGDDSGAKCDRDECDLFEQTNIEGAPNACHDNCFSASCDWSRELCMGPREAARSCPLIDAAAFRSIRAAQPAPVFMEGGNSQGGFGRCGSPCGPAASRNAASMVGAGIVGASALYLVPRANSTMDARPSPPGWLHMPIHKAPTSRGSAGGTLEAWLQVPDLCVEARASPLFWVLADANYAVVMRANQVHSSSAGTASLSSQRIVWPLLFWTSPPAQQCSSVTPTLTSSTGSIGDGPGMLARYDSEGPLRCSWILAPDGAQEVVLFFTQFLLTSYDSLEVYSCFDLGCVNKTHEMSQKGSAMPRPFVSTTPIVLVTLINDGSGSTVVGASSPGFTASYAGVPTQSSSMSIGAWHHVAVSIRSSGLAELIINGSLFSTSQLPLDASPPGPNGFFGGTHDTAIGQGSPDWQEGGVQGLGGSCVAVDELRVWTRARSEENISAHMHVGCTGLSRSNDGLVACYSFDEFESDEFPDSSPNGLHAHAVEHGWPYRQWCVNMDDGGELRLDRDDNVDWSSTPMWGYCASKPRLPGAGFDYDEGEMQLASDRLDLGTAAVLEHYPGCGDIPLWLEENTAGGSGGAIYYDSCSRLQTSCFVQGVGALAGSKAIILRHNQAKAGGAIYVECRELGKECTQIFDKSNRLGVLPKLPKVERGDNAASGYGASIATQPKLLQWHQSPDGLLVVPSRPSQASSGVLQLQEQRADIPRQVTAAVQPIDDRGSVARGIEDVLEVRVCPESGPCNKEDSLVPVLFLPFNEMTGSSSVSTYVECPLGADRVAVEANLIKYDVPTLRANVGCAECRSNESKTEDTGTATWFCSPCAINEYIVDPNNAAHSCQACPAGATCNSSDFFPKPGSFWEEDKVFGVYRIIRCASGFSIVKAPDLMQACNPCQAGYYCPGGTSEQLKCPEKSYSKPNSTSQDACVDADFVGLTLVLPLSRGDFDQDKQADFRMAIAAAAGVESYSARIVGIDQISDRRSTLASSRALLASSLSVEAEIASLDGDAQSLVRRLDESTINSVLREYGLPAGTLSSPPTVKSDASPEYAIEIIAVLVVLALLVAALAAYLFARKGAGSSAATEPKITEEMKREAAVERTRIRRSEFDARMAEKEARSRRAEERKQRKEARAQNAAQAAQNASHVAPPPPQPLTAPPQSALVFASSAGGSEQPAHAAPILASVPSVSPASLLPPDGGAMLSEQQPAGFDCCRTPPLAGNVSPSDDDEVDSDEEAELLREQEQELARRAQEMRQKEQELAQEEARRAEQMAMISLLRERKLLHVKNFYSATAAIATPRRSSASFSLQSAAGDLCRDTRLELLVSVTPSQRQSKVVQTPKEISLCMIIASEVFNVRVRRAISLTGPSKPI